MLSQLSCYSVRGAISCLYSKERLCNLIAALNWIEVAYAFPLRTVLLCLASNHDVADWIWYRFRQPLKSTSKHCVLIVFWLLAAFCLIFGIWIGLSLSSSSSNTYHLYVHSTIKYDCRIPKSAVLYYSSMYTLNVILKYKIVTMTLHIQVRHCYYTALAYNH